jgi:hypothetical protein
MDTGAFSMQRSSKSPGNAGGFRRFPASSPLLSGIFLGALSILLSGHVLAGEDVPGDPGEPGGDGTVILAEGHVWRFFRGTQDPPAEWNQPGFDDSAWEEGPTGIGYGDEDDETVLEDMRCVPIEGAGEGENRCADGGYLAFFARASFEAPAIGEGQRLRLVVSYDDGFVVYLNGAQLGRINMPDGPVSGSTAAVAAVGDAPNEPDAVLPIPAELLRDGTNVLAASVHNVNLSSSDASFIPRLVLGPAEEPPPPEPGCRDRCEARAREAAAACAAEGIPEEECAARKERVFLECVQSECEPDPPPPEPGCEGRCEEAARKVFDNCRSEGGSEDQCRDQLQAAFRECVSGCEENPPEEPCADECASSGKAVFQACVEAGGNEDECRRRADGIVSLCLERCGVGTPCEDRCAVAAQIVLTGCNLAELPEGDCRAMANSVLERCVGGCEPAPSCEEGCQELARRAVAECTERGGPAEECEAAGAVVIAECEAHCDGEPVPGCDLQCEDKAEEMLAHCLREGHSEDECKAERDAFLARCKEELGEVCDQELAALESAFQLFRRGDSNRDEKIDISDAVDVLGHLFLGTTTLPCEDAADANDDGEVNISDPVLILNALFLGSGSLPEPAGEKGQDPTSDRLLCEG